VRFGQPVAAARIEVVGCLPARHSMNYSVSSGFINEADVLYAVSVGSTFADSIPFHKTLLFKLIVAGLAATNMSCYSTYSDG
jgi:hypothetical protein